MLTYAQRVKNTVIDLLLQFTELNLMQATVIYDWLISENLICDPDETPFPHYDMEKRYMDPELYTAIVENAVEPINDHKIVIVKQSIYRKVA